MGKGVDKGIGKKGKGAGGEGQQRGVDQGGEESQQGRVWAAERRDAGGGGVGGDSAEPGRSSTVR